jgi:hypothetical protein
VWRTEAAHGEEGGVSLRRDYRTRHTFRIGEAPGGGTRIDTGIAEVRSAGPKTATPWNPLTPDQPSLGTASVC